MKQYIKNVKKFKIIMLINLMFIYLLKKFNKKQQKISNMIEEHPKITLEKQSKKNPQITAKIAVSSFFKNKALQIAKGKIKTGFAL